MSAKSTWTDQRLESIIANLLRCGVILSAALVLAGGLLYLIRYGSELPHYRVFHGEPADLRSLRGIVTDALSLRSRGLIDLGLLLLIATPVARVAFSVFAYLQQRDGTYVLITLLVLAVLLYSLLGGIPR
jgi:uncharacterized membrane protein